jgi:hypothetical protein
MPLVSGAFDLSTEMKAAIEQSERSTLCLLVRGVIFDECFELVGQQAADRRIPARGQNPRFAQSSAIQP